MPINGELLGLQRRDAPLGEIRIGTSVEATDKNGKPYRKAKRLETFRFTTSEANAHAVAALYGGQAAPWTQRKGKWEVVTDRAALDVWVPPRGLAVDANMELWDGPKRLRRCDGITEALSGGPCMCPRGDAGDAASIQRAYDERKRLSKLRPPQACKTLTRINVTIPGLPGLTGTWRLNTGSENAAVETSGSGDTMVIAREGGVYLPAVLSIQWRYRAEDGSPYPVPFLQIGMSMQELAEGQLPAGPGGLLAQLQAAASGIPLAVGGGQQARALTAAPAAEGEDEGMSAQYYADLVPMALNREEVAAIAADAKKDGVIGHMVRVGEDEPREQLRAYLERTWQGFPPMATVGAA
jgi:Recombination directionality factor-like